MSINHFSTAVPETFWRAPPRRHDGVVGSPPDPYRFQVTGFDFNLNRSEDGHDELLEDRRETPCGPGDREQLFEKPLTPSDVGKLNRLVIPKQHAERCFPLGGMGGSADSGLLLSFEDESGKSWRFRYSYWSSSQSYVLTKGWSRFVKEKKLDAGDVVLFERDRVNCDRLFIGWRRRRGEPTPVSAEYPSGGWGRTGAVGGNGYGSPAQYPSVDPEQCTNHAGSAARDTNMPSSGNSKRFRLFGVNLECQGQPDDDSDGSPSAYQHFGYPDTYHGNLYNYMDVNQIRNCRG